ncbi:heavy metal translocating P-type ATPase [Halococcus hamelinensis 100A6]|uniref:Heavy metal translocating P-type ATPase n=1 Tax=Halococcus hamelinensis 100A6 TaxID=1132509 RepID=M0M8L5_9EURY|nr:hypothetical protein [Halococcus hamelinensis]EMA42066.1 heavy metal translocating P-type ATPase [Halococcus hamelinensis 100A6]
MGGAGTDVALDTANVVLMGDDLSKIPYVLGLGRKTRRTLTINLAIAFGAGMSTLVIGLVSSQASLREISPWVNTLL